MRENWGYMVSLHAMSATVGVLRNELCSDPYIYDLYIYRSQKTAEIKFLDAVIIDVFMSQHSNI